MRILKRHILNNNQRFGFMFYCFVLFSCVPEKEPLILPQCVVNNLVDGKYVFSQLEDNTEVMGSIDIIMDYACNEGAKLFINNELYPIERGLSITESGFYNIKLSFDESVCEKNVVVMDKLRGESEWGLKSWVPSTILYDDKTAGNVDLIYPSKVLANKDVPVVIYTKTNDSIYPNYSRITMPNNQACNLKRGVGSIQLNEFLFNKDMNIKVGNVNVTMQLDSLSLKKIIFLNNSITTNIVVDAFTIVYIENDLTINEGCGLTLLEGCNVFISEGVTVYNQGIIQFNGVKESPILVTAEKNDKFWGGFVSRGTFSNINADYTFFCRSGFNQNGNFTLGHAKRQALFQLDNSNIELNNCYLLDHIGQIFYPVESYLALNNLLIQRAKTGGQFNLSQAEITNCVFTDFPDDTDVFHDEDNDAIYFAENCKVVVDNCTFMYAKDDGIDSGSAAGGEFFITNSHFEACFHEGLALSGEEGEKTHLVENCVFKNNGQGVELGFSSAKHLVDVKNCIFSNNYIGIRYGDNYTWSNPEGTLKITDSYAISNEIDVWNMVRMDWKPRIENTVFSNLKISKYSFQYPELEIVE